MKLFKIIFSLYRKIIGLFVFCIRYFQFREIHRSNKIKSPILITPKYISLGKGVHIRNNARIEGVAKYNSTLYNPHIIIGENVGIEQNVHITCADLIEIGANTAIAANVTITDIHHPYDDISLPIEKQNLKVNPVKIGRDCKIYNNAVVLPGVQIGDHVTVGANSVVNVSLPDYCVAVGSPAYIIKRYNFESQKWEKTDKEGNFLIR